MPIIMEPRDEGHILYAKIFDPLILKDLQDIYAHEQRYRDDSKVTMHTFINISELRKIPPASLTMVRRSPTLNHPRRGQLVLVGASAFAEALVDVLARVTRASKVRFFKTDDEGMAYLRRVIADETVQTLPPKMADVSTSPSGGSSIAS